MDYLQAKVDITKAVLENSKDKSQKEIEAIIKSLLNIIHHDSH